MLVMGFLDIRNTKSVNRAQAMMDSIRKVIEMSVIICHNAKIVKMPDFSSTISGKIVDEPGKTTNSSTKTAKIVDEPG